MEHNLWQHPRLEKKGVKGSLRGTLRSLSALYRRLAAKKPDLELPPIGYGRRPGRPSQR